MLLVAERPAIPIVITRVLVRAGAVHDAPGRGGLANLTGAATPFRVVVPQIVLSILAYPLVGRFVAAADRFRLTPFPEFR